MSEALSRFNFMMRFTAVFGDSAVETGDIGVATTQVGSIYEPPTAFTSGTSANQADRYACTHDRAMVGAASIDFELFDDTAGNFTGTGTGLNLLGNGHDMAEIVAFWIYNQPASTGNLTVGNKGDGTEWVTGPFPSTHTLLLAPGVGVGMICPADGKWTVANGTDIFKFASSANLTFDFDLYGRSA
jgi:hypothetical protein